VGAIRANDFPRQANESGRAGGDHASLRTDPDDAERDTGIYRSKGWGFESLRAPGPLLAALVAPPVDVPRGLAPVTAGAELTGCQHDLERDYRLDVQKREKPPASGVTSA
jgi:hypothetical protein